MIESNVIEGGNTTLLPRKVDEIRGIGGIGESVHPQNPLHIFPWTDSRTTNGFRRIGGIGGESVHPRSPPPRGFRQGVFEDVGGFSVKPRRESGPLGTDFVDPLDRWQNRSTCSRLR